MLGVGTREERHNRRVFPAGKPEQQPMGGHLCIQAYTSDRRSDGLTMVAKILGEPRAAGRGSGWRPASGGYSSRGPSRWSGRRSLRWFRLVSALVAMMSVVLLVWCSPVLAASVGEESVSDVSSSSATLQACIVSGGSEADDTFEYGTSVSYSSTVEAAPGAAGSCSSGLSVEAHVQGFLAHTLYYYRAVAGTIDGPGQVFTTQPAGGELTLPDSRVWELVSPAVKDGALIPPIESGAGIVEAAEGGGAITYPSNGPLGANPPANANETQMLSVRRLDGGWSSQDIATPHKIVAGADIGIGQEYRAFSSDLSVGLVEPFGLGYATVEAEGAVPLSEGASEATPYLRADLPLSGEPGSSEHAVYNEAEMEGGYLPLVTGCPPIGEKCKARVEERANAPPGTKFGGDIKFLGADTDLSHVIVRSNEAPLVVGAEEENLYEWSADKSPGEQLQLVSVLPDVPPYEGGQARGAAELGGGSGEDARGAVSSDGSRVVWSYKGHLFMRYSLGGQNWQTVQLDVGADENGHADFQFASSDGSKVFFTDQEHLTSDSGAVAGEPELYECEMVEEAGGLVCDLNDLTIAKTSESADVQGMVITGGNDSTYVYLVAKGILTGEKDAQDEKANVGKDNLYMLHYNDQAKEWKPTFIAVLSEEDGPDWAQGGGGGLLEAMTSGVSPDGKYLVFMSENSLTGYDNVDINSGAPDEEVYLYGAPSAGVLSGRLVCVSCNPTGERPAGVLDNAAAHGGYGLFIDRQKIWSEGRWLAGSVPGWTGMSLGRARYQSRYVSNSGRVFFDSPDGLVPQATNGLVDVYEYEPEGVPAEGPDSCAVSSSSFSVAAGGCIGLISSGSSDEESVFLDASGSGDDVFFLTSAPLVGADKDTAFDVYDAHACSVVAPCSPEAVSPPACVTAEGCRVSPSLQPSVFGPPASATFAGQGNQVVSVSVSVTKCGKGKKLKEGKCVKVKATTDKEKGKGKNKRKVGVKVRGAGDGREVAR
jgi:hypothetical protein